MTGARSNCLTLGRHRLFLSPTGPKAVDSSAKRLGPSLTLERTTQTSDHPGAMYTFHKSINSCGAIFSRSSTYPLWLEIVMLRELAVVEKERKTHLQKTPLPLNRRSRDRLPHKHIHVPRHSTIRIPRDPRPILFKELVQNPRQQLRWYLFPRLFLVVILLLFFPVLFIIITPNVPSSSWWLLCPGIHIHVRFFAVLVISPLQIDNLPFTVLLFLLLPCPFPPSTPSSTAPTPAPPPSPSSCTTPTSRC